MTTAKFLFRIILPTLAISIFTSACQPALKEPKFVNHEMPTLSVNTPSFESLGCQPDSPGGFNRCSENSTLKSLGCFSVDTPNSLFGGLDPNYPLIECTLEGTRYLYTLGCLSAQNIGLVAHRDGAYQLIDSESALREIYAPIESEEEALSYALAGTGLLAYYNLSLSDEYQYYADRIEDTYIIKDGKDFLVHLYYYQLCGCGPHETHAVDVKVTHDGQISRFEKNWFTKILT